MQTLLQDLRYAARGIANHLGFTIVVVFTLALGIGANTAVFSVINAIFLRPLPGVVEPDRLFHLFARQEENESNSSLSYLAYLDYRGVSSPFESLAAWAMTPVSTSDSEGGEQGTAILVSDNFFSVAGARPAVGRFFLPEEMRTPGTHPVAVLGHEFWRKRFSGSSGVLGRSVEIDGHPFTIVGVAPAGFRGMVPIFTPDVWIPLTMANQVKPGADRLADRNIGWLSVTGRLKRGVTDTQASVRMQQVARQLRETVPDENRGESVALASASTLGRLDDSNALGVTALLTIVAGLVLLIACANVASMLLGRAAARQKELAIRTAIGATRKRIIRQLLTETLLLFTIAGAGGMVVAVAANHVLAKFQASITAGVTIDLGLDLRVLAFTLLASLLTGLIFGLFPALSASRTDLTATLKGAAGGVRQSRMRSAFVIAQVAMSTLLLVGAGLFLRVLRQAEAVELGFDPTGVQMVELDLLNLGYDDVRGRHFYEELVRQLQRVPGVEGVAFANTVPLGAGTQKTQVTTPGSGTAEGRPALVDFSIVDPAYFPTLEIPLAAGRPFNGADRRGSPPVAIVNESFARRFWPGDQAVGKRLSRGDTEIEIIGVARDSKYNSLQEAPTPFIYLPLGQHYVPVAVCLVRTGAKDGGATMAAVREQIRGIDPRLSAVETRSLARRVETTLMPQRTSFQFTGLLGLLGLALAAVGVYGVVAHAVAQRTREFGIRIAVGANTSEVLRLVLGQGLRMAGMGIGIGLAVSLIGMRALSSVLPGVGSSDPLTFGGVAVLLISVALSASYIPARRATRIDPVTALRAE